MIEIICEKMKKLRISANITQEELCEIISEQGFLLTRTAYCKYENGKRTFPYELLCRLAVFYGVSLDFIFGLNDFSLDS